MIVEKKGIVYELDMNKKTGSVKYSDSMLIEAKILETINGCVIDTIDSKGFFHCEKLKKVYIPDTIKKIKNDAFNSCYKLKKINNNNNINAEIIGFFAFANCKSLTSIKFNELISLGKGALSNCEELKFVYFPEDGFEIIEENTIMNCSNLMDIILTKGIKKVKNNFEGCSNLNKITFKNNNLDLMPFIQNISKDVLLLGENHSTAQQLSIYGYNFKLVN